MSKKNNTRQKARKDTSYSQDHFDYIEKSAKKQGIAFAQVVRQILTMGIKSHKKNKDY